MFCTPTRMLTIANMAPPLCFLMRVNAGAVFCLSGTLSSSRAAVKSTIESEGGSVASSVTAKVNFLISTVAEVKKNTSKVSEHKSCC